MFPFMTIIRISEGCDEEWNTDQINGCWGDAEGFRLEPPRVNET
jgi:hypothetical protein